MDSSTSSSPDEPDADVSKERKENNDDGWKDGEFGTNADSELEDNNEVDNYKDWDPMIEESESVLNCMGGDYLAATVGAPSRLYCWFPTVPGTNSCFKGKNCTWPHREVPSLISDDISDIFQPHFKDADGGIPKSDKDRVVVKLYEALPRQRTCPQGTVLMGKVVHVVNPSEFYIIPLTTWTCLCRNNLSAPIDQKELEDKNYPHFVYSGLKMFSKTMTALQPAIDAIVRRGSRRYRHHDSKKRTMFYSHSEVVACEMEAADKTRLWYRAVITEPTYDLPGFVPPDNSPCLLNFRRPQAHLTLLDTGEKVSKTIDKIRWIPEPFTDIPPYAYKCCLFGIVPISDVWCPTIKAKFKSLVHEKQVLVEIKRTVFSEQDELAGVFGEKPYLVSLRVKDELNGDWKCVEQHLMESRMAIAFNPFLLSLRYLEIQKQKGLLRGKALECRKLGLFAPE